MEIILLHIARYLQKAWPVVTLSVFLCFSAASASAQTDSLRMLDEVQVGYKQPPQGVSRHSDGTVHISSMSLRRGMRMLGEADAITASIMLPGISTAGDYASGVSVGGSDFAHTVYSIDGATVFFPYRFGGIFSDFNPAHVSGVTIGTQTDGASPVALGANYQAYTYGNMAVPERVSGIANVGMLASGLSVCTPVGSSGGIKASGRLSYLNALYDWLLTDGDNDVRYGFGDLNVSGIRRFGADKCLQVSALYSDDQLRFDEADFMLGTRLDWQNAGASSVFSISRGDIDFTQRVAWSSLRSRLTLGMPQFSLQMPSAVSQIMANGELSSASKGTEFGYRLEYNWFEPQSPRASGLIDVSSAGRRYQSLMGTVGGSKSLEIDSLRSLSLALRVIGYGCGDYHHVGVSPAVAYGYQGAASAFSAAISYRSQYMHQVGFSDIGLASNFYLPAIRKLPAERSFGIDVDYSRNVLDASRLSVAANAFAKAVFDTPEYTGDVLSLSTGGYDPVASVVTDRGYNLGGSVTAFYDFGALSGWAGYALTVCRRKYDDERQWTSAATEPLHSLKILTVYRLNARLSVSAYFTLASGRPYTPIKAIFIAGGNVLSEYGLRNSARLPAYHRLDLSMTYDLPCIHVAGRNVYHFINLSLLNAYGHDNIEMQYYKYDNVNNTIRLQRVRSIMRFLPSVSYTVQL